MKVMRSGYGRSATAIDLPRADEGRTHFDVVIIGSGPAGVSIAERLFERTSVVSIAVIERGPLLLRRHFYDSASSISARDAFFAAHRDNQWDGDLSPGGGLLPCVGGRGVVGGSQLHRFYDDDFDLWNDGMWPLAAADMETHYRAAELRLLGATRAVGHSQEFACSALAQFGARHPPYGAGDQTASGPDVGFPYRSSAERLLALLGSDHLANYPRLRVFTDLCAVELIVDQENSDTVSHVRCLSVAQPARAEWSIFGTFFVLAASPVESARLVLTSRLADCGSSRSAVGRYLAEHIYCRGIADISSNTDLGAGPINLFVQPPGNNSEQRYQIELRSISTGGASGLLRVTGSAAMDPVSENRVTLSPDKVDSYGRPAAHTVLQYSRGDQARVTAMLETISQVVNCLGGEWMERPSVLAKGASFHEAGTLRMAEKDLVGAADADGRLNGSINVFVGDGAAFPCVGVANPILTLTALGYRLGDKLAHLLGAS